MKKQQSISFIFIGLIVFSAIYFIIFRNQKTMVETDVSEIGSNGAFQPTVQPSKNNVTPSYSEHVDQLKHSVEKNPNNVSHRKALGQLLMDGHQPKEAIKYFEEALALTPKDDSLLFDMTMCYFTERQYDKALITTEKILSFSPKRPQALYNKGVILSAMGKAEEAEKTWKKLIAVMPSSDEAKMAKNYLSKISMK